MNAVTRTELLEDLPPVEKAQLDQEGKADDIGAEPLQRARSRPPCRRWQQIVDDQRFALPHRVSMDLERVGAVFERVLFAKVSRKFPGLRTATKPAPSA